MEALNRFLEEARQNLVIERDQAAMRRDLELALDYLESIHLELTEALRQLDLHRAENADLASRIEFILDLYRQDKQRFVASADHHLEREERHQKQVDTLTRILQETTKMLASGNINEANKMLEAVGMTWYTKQTGRTPKLDEIIGDMETRIRNRQENGPFQITDTDAVADAASKPDPSTVPSKDGSPKAVLKAYEEALSSQRWEEVRPFFVDDACVIFSNGALHQGLAAIQAAFQRNFDTIKSETYRISELQWIHLGEEAATGIYRFDWSGIINGEHRSGKGRGACTLVRRQQDWLIQLEHLGLYYP